MSEESWVLRDVSLENSAFKIFKVGSSNGLAEKKDQTVAILISCIPELNIDLATIRAKFNTEKSYPAKPDLKHIKDNIYELEYDSSGELLLPRFQVIDEEFALINILEKYKLSERWLNSIAALYRYGVFILPLNTKFKVELSNELIYKMNQLRSTKYKPLKARGGGSALDTLLGRDVEILHPETEVIPKEALKLIITVSEQMSAAELGRLISKSNSVKNKLSKLNKTPYSYMPPINNGLLWGHYVWAHKQYINSRDSMERIEKKLDESLGSNVIVPDARELGVFYKRFIMARQNFIP